MNHAKYIARVVFLILAIFLLVDLNRKTDGKTKSIAEFKIKMIEKAQKDSLDSRHKMEMLIDETTKFVDSSSHVKKRIGHLMLLLALFLMTEVAFKILSKRNTEQ
jgi:hypothetical protein